MAFPHNIYTRPFVPVYTGPNRDFPYEPDLFKLMDAWPLDWKIDKVWYYTPGIPSHQVLSAQTKTHSVWVQAGDGSWETRLSHYEDHGGGFSSHVHYSFRTGEDLYEVLRALRKML